MIVNLLAAAAVKSLGLFNRLAIAYVSHKHSK